MITTNQVCTQKPQFLSCSLGSDLTDSTVWYLMGKKNLHMLQFSFAAVDSSDYVS